MYMYVIRTIVLLSSRPCAGVSHQSPPLPTNLPNKPHLTPTFVPTPAMPPAMPVRDLLPHLEDEIQDADQGDAPSVAPHGPARPN